MQTSTHTLSHHATFSSSINMYSGSEGTVEEKRQDVFKLNDEKKHTESIEKEKRPKKEIGDFLHAGKERYAVINSKVSSNHNQHIQFISVVSELGEEMLFVNSKVSSSSQNSVLILFLTIAL